MIKSLVHQELKCTKSITDFVEGKNYHVSIQRMTGRMYKPGKHIVNGKQEWIDKEGQPENKIMIFTGSAYCCRPLEVLDQHFESVS